ncbi:MAG: hypothetical protein Q7S49_02230 [bacterium]|nr:hypothetical protein [bacterium]
MNPELTRRLKEQDYIRREVIWKYARRRPALSLMDMIIKLEKRVSNIEKKLLK